MSRKSPSNSAGLPSVTPRSDDAIQAIAEILSGIVNGRDRALPPPPWATDHAKVILREMEGRGLAVSQAGPVERPSRRFSAGLCGND